MKLLAVLLSLLLMSCGGGGTISESSISSAVSVSVFGDSLTSDGSLAVTTVQRMQQQLGTGYIVHDYSAPSMRASDALERNPAFPNYTTHLNSNIVLILYGGADVIGQTPPEVFEADMRQLIAQAKAAGAQVVLATVINHPKYQEGVSLINTVIRRLATECSCGLVDAYAIPTGGFIADGIHPDQAYSDARAALITLAVEQVKE